MKTIRKIMNNLSVITILTLLLTSLLTSISAHAGLITYNVSNAMNNLGKDIGYGLYTFNKNNTGSAKYSIQSGIFLPLILKERHQIPMILQL
jgi:hypothetical protein